MKIEAGADSAAVYLEAEEHTSKFYSFVGRICFFTFVFFTMFGTTLPFRPKNLDVSEIQTSNVATQIVYVSLFILGLIAIAPKTKFVLNFLIKEKFVTLFILFALSSIVWSSFPYVSFKRWFQVFAAFIACLGGLLYINSDETLLKYLRPTIGIFLLISLATCLTIPAAKDDLGVWRGLAPSKNHLGQAAFFGAITFSYSFIISKWLGKIISALMIIISLILLKGSQSSTAQLSFVIIMGMWFLQFIDNRFKALGIGRFFSVFAVVSMFTVAILAWTLAPDMVSQGFQDIGEDMSFTGRTDLWQDMIDRANTHALLGGGYGGFWVLDNNDLRHLYEKYIWLPNQSHDGYIDIYLDLGIVGIILLIAVIINYFISLQRLKEPHFWKWFVMGVLLTNFQESTLFRQGTFLGNFFILFVLLLMMKSYKASIAPGKLVEEEVQQIPMKTSPY